MAIFHWTLIWLLNWFYGGLMLFSDIWSGNAGLVERLMEIHSNPPILYYSFKVMWYHRSIFSFMLKLAWGEEHYNSGFIHVYLISGKVETNWLCNTVTWTIPFGGSPFMWPGLYCWYTSIVLSYKFGNRTNHGPNQGLYGRWAFIFHFKRTLDTWPSAS